MPAAPKTVARITLGREIRRLRESTDTPIDAILNKLGWTANKLSRIENGSGTVATAEIDALVDLFGVNDEVADRLRALGSDARKRAAYGRTPDWARTYVEWEGDASSIQTFESELVPGLLQTGDYTRAVVRGSVVANKADVDQIVSDRARRQQVLERADPPTFEVVLSEAVLRRAVGGAAVMRDQLDRLIQMFDQPNVTLQVLPFSSGAHAAMGSTFVVLTLGESDVAAVYLEDLTSADYLDGSRHVGAYTLAFRQLQVQALGPMESSQLIQHVRDEMS